MPRKGCLAVMLIAILGGCGVDEVEIESETRGKADMANALDYGPDSSIWTNQTLRCGDRHRRLPHGEYNYRREANMDRVWVYRGRANALNRIFFRPDSFGRRGGYMRIYDAKKKPLLTGYCRPDDGKKKRFDECIGDYRSRDHDSTLSEIDCDDGTLKMSFEIVEGHEAKLLLQIGPICNQPEPDGYRPDYGLSAHCLDHDHEDYFEPAFTVR